MSKCQQISGSKVFYRASFRQRLVCGLVFFGIAAFFGLFMLVANDEVQIDRWLEPCGFKQRYHLPCPTCGVTTSIVAFAKGRLLGSFYIQPAGALLCCILAFSAFLAFIGAVFGVYFSFLRRFFAQVKIIHIILAVLIIIAAGWAVTLARTLAESNG